MNKKKENKESKLISKLLKECEKLEKLSGIALPAETKAVLEKVIKNDIPEESQVKDLDESN